MQERNMCNQSSFPRQAEKQIQILAIQFSCLWIQRKKESIDMFFLHHVPSSEFGQRSGEPANEAGERIQIRCERFECQRSFRVQLDLPVSVRQALIAVHFYGPTIALGEFSYLSLQRVQRFLLFAAFYQELFLDQKCSEEGRIKSGTHLFDHLLQPPLLHPLWPFEAPLRFLKDGERFGEHISTRLKTDFVLLKEKTKFFDQLLSPVSRKCLVEVFFAQEVPGAFLFLASVTVSPPILQIRRPEITSTCWTTTLLHLQFAPPPKSVARFFRHYH